MSQDPRDYFRKVQQTLSSASAKGKGGLPGGPRNFFGGAAGLLLLGGGVLVVNNALFNGMMVLLTHSVTIFADILQWTVVIEPLNTLE
jgi:hypothetical protein